MAMPGQEVVDRAERAIAELIQDTNVAAASARTAWLFFMALIGFFVVALAGVTHKDLLLETPVELPLLQVKIPQASFFLFGPLILLLVHLSLLLQHVTLARKLKDAHERLTRHEGNGFLRQHRLRSLVHSYAMAQAVAGPWRSPVLGFFLHVINWATLVLLPILVLLNFQLTYLPWHEATTTMLHRIYLAADILILLLLGVLILMPDRMFFSALGAGFLQHPLSMVATLLMAIAAMFFSMLVATIPDGTLDRFASGLWPVKIEAGPQRGGTPRTAFAPTAWLFDGPLDEIQGRPDSLFSRNLVVINTPLVQPVNPEPDDASLNLRGRDLRYATFDRSDMRRSDLTGADLTGASLMRTGLIKARLNRATLTGTDMRGAEIISTFIRGATLDNVRVCSEQRLMFMGDAARGEEIKGLVKEPCPKDR